MNKFSKLRDSAQEQALWAKALLTCCARKRETTNEERAELAKNPLKDKLLEVGDSIRSLYFRLLQSTLSRKFRDTQLSGDFTELMDAGEDSTSKVEALWQKVKNRVNTDEAVDEWLNTGVMRERVKKHPEFLQSAKEFAVKYLRFLFAKKLNGEPVEEGAVHSDVPDDTAT